MKIQSSYIWAQKTIGRTKAFKKTNPGLNLNSIAKNLDVSSIFLGDLPLKNQKMFWRGPGQAQNIVKPRNFNCLLSKRPMLRSNLTTCDSPAQTHLGFVLCSTIPLECIPDFHCHSSARFPHRHLFSSQLKLFQKTKRCHQKFTMMAELLRSRLQRKKCMSYFPKKQVQNLSGPPKQLAGTNLVPCKYCPWNSVWKASISCSITKHKNKATLKE